MWIVHGFEGKGASTRAHAGAFFAGEREVLRSGNSVYRLKDGKSGRVLAVWESGNERYAFVDFDLPHVPDSYENQRDLCRSPIGHTGSPCMFCGYEAQPEKK